MTRTELISNHVLNKYSLTKIGLLYEDQLSGYLSLKKNGKLDKHKNQSTIYHLPDKMSTTELVVLSVLTYASESIKGISHSKTFDYSNRKSIACFSDDIFSPRSFYRSILGLSLRSNEKGFRLIKKTGTVIKLFTIKLNLPVKIVKLDISNRKFSLLCPNKVLGRPSFILSFSFILHHAVLNYATQNKYLVTALEIKSLPQTIGITKKSFQNACNFLISQNIVRTDLYGNIIISESLINTYKRMENKTEKVSMILLQIEKRNLSIKRY